MKICLPRLALCSLVLLGAVICTTNSVATNYYIDYEKGLDTGAGLSIEDAMKHCPGDPAATQTAKETILVPGDTVYFKGGTTYIFTGATGIDIPWAGKPGLPITYDGAPRDKMEGNQIGLWGTTNRAKFMANYNTNGTQINPVLNGFDAHNLKSMDWINFRNLDIGPVGGSLVLPADPGKAVPSVWGTGIAKSGPMNNVIISNCYFHALGYWFNRKPMDAASINGAGIMAQGFTNLTITNCEFTKTHTACSIALSGTNRNLEIGGCDFHDYIVWGIDLGVTSEGTSVDDIYIHNNKFHDYDRYYSDGTNSWQGYGGSGSWPHCDGIFVRGDTVKSFSPGTNVNIYANNFYSTFNDSTGGTAQIYLTGSGSANIYNNVFSMAACANGAITISDPDTLVPFLTRVYNNTFFCNYKPQIMLGGKQDGSWPAVNGIELDVRNNIFYDTALNSGNNFLVYINLTNGAGGTNMFFDHNCYRTKNLDGTFFNWPKWAGEMNFDGTLRAGNSTRKLLHWETNGTVLEPSFTLADPSNYLTNDYHLAAASRTNIIATNGLNFSNLKLRGLNLDKEGNPRPATGAWSLGAYQPMMATNSSASTGSSTTVTNTTTTTNSASSSTATTNTTANASTGSTNSPSLTNTISNVTTNVPVVLATSSTTFTSTTSTIRTAMTMVVTNTTVTTGTTNTTGTGTTNATSSGTTSSTTGTTNTTSSGTTAGTGSGSTTNTTTTASSGTTTGTGTTTGSGSGTTTTGTTNTTSSGTTAGTGSGTSSTTNTTSTASSGTGTGTTNTTTGTTNTSATTAGTGSGTTSTTNTTTTVTSGTTSSGTNSTTTATSGGTGTSTGSTNTTTTASSSGSGTGTGTTNSTTTVTAPTPPPIPSAPQKLVVLTTQ